MSNTWRSPLTGCIFALSKQKQNTSKQKIKNTTNVKNIPVHRHPCLPCCRSEYLRKPPPYFKTNKKTQNMKSILLASVGLLLRTYLGVAFIMIFVKKQKAKRTERKMALATLKDAQKHAQA